MRRRASARASAIAVREGSFQASITAAKGEPFTQAAAHPAALSAGFELAEGAAEELERVTLDLPVGVVLDPEALAHQCSRAQFESGGGAPACPAESRVGADELGLYGGSDPVEATDGCSLRPKGWR